MLASIFACHVTILRLRRRRRTSRRLRKIRRPPPPNPPPPNPPPPNPPPHHPSSRERRPPPIPVPREENARAGHDDENDDQDNDESQSAPPASLTLGGKRLVFTTCSFFDRQNRLFDSGGRIARAKFRSQLIADDLRRSRIGQYALKTVSNFNPHLFLLHENRKQNTVVALLLSDFPRGKKPVCKIIHIFVFERGEGRDNNLVTGLFFELRELILQTIFGGRIKNGSVVTDSAGRLSRNVERTC